MKSLDTLFSLFNTSRLLVLFGGVLLAVWNQRRPHRYLLWQVTSVLLLGCAYAIAVDRHMQWTYHTVALWALWCSVLATVQAMALRYGQPVKGYVVVLSAVLTLLASSPDGMFALSTQGRGMVIALAAGLLLLHVLPRVWHCAARHLADQVLRAVYTAAALWVLLAAWWGPHSALALWGVCWAFVLSAALVASAWRDGATQPRTSEYRDAPTHLLNRAGLDAVCGDAPAQHSITMVMLCEFKPAGSPADAETALQAFAHLLHSSVREGDLVARTGAEEFVLAWRGIDLQHAHAWLMRLQTVLRRTEWAESHVLSWGMAEVEETDSLDVVLHRADVALCQMKEEEELCCSQLANAF